MKRGVNLLVQVCVFLRVFLKLVLVVVATDDAPRLSPPLGLDFSFDCPLAFTQCW